MDGVRFWLWALVAGHAAGTLYIDDEVHLKEIAPRAKG